MREATVRDSPAPACCATARSASVVPAIADDHDDGGLRTKTMDDVDGVADGGGVGQRRTAELVDVGRAAGSWHGEEDMTRRKGEALVASQVDARRIAGETGPSGNLTTSPHHAPGRLPPDPCLSS